MEEIRKVLAEKCEASDEVRNKSANRIREEFYKFIEDLKKIEADLLSTVDRSFGDNAFSFALASLDYDSKSPEAQAQARNVSEMSVPLLMGPTNETLETFRQAVSALRGSILQPPQNFKG